MKRHASGKRKKQLWFFTPCFELKTRVKIFNFVRSDTTCLFWGAHKNSENPRETASKIKIKLRGQKCAFHKEWSIKRSYFIFILFGREQEKSENDFPFTDEASRTPTSPSPSRILLAVCYDDASRFFFFHFCASQIESKRKIRYKILLKNI